MSRFQITIKLGRSHTFSPINPATSPLWSGVNQHCMGRVTVCVAGVTAGQLSVSWRLARAHPSALAARATLTDFHTTNSADLVQAWRLLWARPPGRRHRRRRARQPAAWRLARAAPGPLSRAPLALPSPAPPAWAPGRNIVRLVG